MGTRSLIAVYMDGEYKIAQYSQWDGDPEGQGCKCLCFLTEKMVEHQFRKRLKSLRTIQSQEQLEAIKSTYKPFIDFPEFNRNTGADILWLVQEFKTTTGCVINRLDFAIGKDDAFACDWAWVIDLDKRTFEAYEGYNKKPLQPGDRFWFLEGLSYGGYHPVKLVAKWSLSNLPEEKEFLETFKKEDET